MKPAYSDHSVALPQEIVYEIFLKVVYGPADDDELLIFVYSAFISHVLYSTGYMYPGFPFVYVTRDHSYILVFWSRVAYLAI